MSGANQAICTLFEGSYHLGVAVLVNSLTRAGFRGAIYAGYRGPLPPWAGTSRTVDLPPWKGVRVLTVADGVELIFVPLETSYHLSNYKPDFMLNLLQHAALAVDAIYYFDPDITVVAPWSFFIRWATCGVAVCEDVHSPCARNHPRRVAWRQYFGEKGFRLNYRQSEYANSGYVGLSNEQFSFLDEWRAIQEAMAPAIGGLEKSSFPNSPMESQLRSPYFHFNCTDQDALNAALETSAHTAAFMTKTAMSFSPGTSALPHAVGSPKPWNKSYLMEALVRGRPPTMADKAYWSFTDGPLEAFTPTHIKRKRMAIAICSVVGRFYRKMG